MELVSNPFQACNDIFFKPNRVFETINQKHNWSWLPFFLVAVLSVLPTYFYFNFVDFDWYREFVISTTMGDVSPAEQDQVRQFMSKGQTLTFGLISQVLVLIIINAILAIYLNLVTKSDEENLNGFTDWYGFTWWVSMPSILSSLVAILIIAMASDHQLPPNEIAVTSLSYWLGLSMDSAWFNFAMSVRLDVLWTMYLTAVGVGRWTHFSQNKCYVIGTAPFLVLWAVWAFFVAI